MLRVSSFSYVSNPHYRIVARLPGPCFQTGLFASTVAQFLSSSYQGLQQNPNVITQSLLAQISQQLPGSPNSTSTAGIPSTNAQASFKPSASVVFVNSVWFISLVLSLTCALMATLLQQWARRYLQLTQRNHPPHVRAHIREYFARGADRFHISTLVEVLPALLLISVLLFFSGLIVYAFLGNNIVAFITVAVLVCCAIWYLRLTLSPLKSHDCPYQTPLSPLFWFCAQVIPFSVFTVAHQGSKLFHKLRVVKTGVVEKFQNLQISKKKTLEQGMLSTLEGSAKCLSLDIFRTALCRTLDLLDEDHELEEFVTGIPGLSESDALRKLDPQSPYHAGRVVLAALPGPTSFHEQLPWSIVHLSQRAVSSGLSEIIQQRRTQACLKALYYTPGAIRDVLAPYAAGAYYCLENLPLLNSADSLDLIEKLWDTTDDDILLSVRCVAAAMSAFMITPPDNLLDKFLPTGVQFIGKDDVGSYFLSKRLPMVANREDNDSARLQNIVRFVKDISAAISKMDADLWMRPDSDGSLLKDVRDERRTLCDSRHSAEYRSGTFKRHGNRDSPAFIPAVQHDLLALTLEIVARDSVTDAEQAQREAFEKVFSELESSVKAAHPPPEGGTKETAKIVVDALRPVAQKLGLRVSTPEPEPEPHNQSSSGAASSSTAAQGMGVEPERPEPEPRSGEEVTPAGAVSSSALEGVTTANGAFSPQSRSTTDASPTSLNKSSYPSHSLASSPGHTERDPATLV